MDRNNPDHSADKISYYPRKNPEELRRLVITQTSMKILLVKPLWKARVASNNNNNNNNNNR